MDTTTTLTTTDSSAGTGVAVVFLLFYLVLALVVLVAVWKVFTKANKPGWAVLIPFYNIYVQLKIIGRPGWWLLLYFIPFVNIVVSIVVAVDLARSFGKSDLFGVIGLWLFSIIGYLMLAFDKNVSYVGPSADQGTSGPAAAPAV